METHISRRAVVPGIYVAAAITTALAILLIGRVLLQSSPRERRWLLAVAFLAHLPMWPIAYHRVRMPLDAVVRQSMDTSATSFPLVKSTYAPLTEEPAKLWMFIIPLVLARLTDKAATIQYAVAMGLLDAANFPILVLILYAAELGQTGHPILASLWVVTVLFGMFALIPWLYGYRIRDVVRLSESRAKCPKCGAAYSRSVLRSLNLRVRRRVFGLNYGYGTCPECNTSAYTGAFTQRDPDAETNAT